MYTKEEREGILWEFHQSGLTVRQACKTLRPFPNRQNLCNWLRMEEAGELVATEMPDRVARMHCAHGEGGGACWRQYSFYRLRQCITPLGAAVEILDQNGQGEHRMLGTEQGRAATEAFVRFDRSYADTIAELGYPSRATPGPWRRGHESAGEIPAGRGRRRKPRHADGRARAAVGHRLAHGGGLSGTTGPWDVPGQAGPPRLDRRAGSRGGEVRGAKAEGRHGAHGEEGAGRCRAGGEDRRRRRGRRAARRAGGGALRLAQGGHGRRWG